ncbi:vacuolar-type H+-ATPase subunit I/STV1 [Salibacterium salarium]|uniref:hypothetical protein n=1 Tax=Salibacterium salarium TaxID=284579 RepID=UPI00278AFC02|nr:hypothetical protein [Salibacterium salarium]MDQ0300208.1 vacuolar-type H+-ATPase subunit I/STV1 [Salibacterium salarium]
MSRQTFGIFMVIVGAIAMIINLSYLKPYEYYDVIRRLSYVLFMVGIFMIPSYSKSEKNR